MQTNCDRMLSTQRTVSAQNDTGSFNKEYHQTRIETSRFGQLHSIILTQKCFSLTLAGTPLYSTKGIYLKNKLKCFNIDSYSFAHFSFKFG